MKKWIVLIAVCFLVACQQQKGDNKMSLIEAVEQQNEQQVQELLAQSTEVDIQNDKGETPLLIATHQNNVAIAKALIDAGADINKQDAIQDSPYLYAGAQGKTEILAYMLAHREPDQTVVNRYGGNALIPAAEKGHLENVKQLLEDGRADINHQNNFGYTALIEAVALTDGSPLYQDIVAELLKHDANTELRDNNDKTALDYAKEKGYTEIEAMLKK
ncbi:ankyrin repeat domain-containing protein [Candidatus Kurthia intestinigallinarum]|uniref:ankyrin repeat domain-containing protein n=1 Tax=Candidatus Kurthia intestinigallinarum TaxID=1562256 RepID=UPI000F8F5B27|nr:ankyrin repeat domain-containing protein [Kurthia sp. 3B1D]